MPMSVHQRSGCSKNDKMTQTTSEKSPSSTNTQIDYDNIEHIRKLELENRILKQKIAEQDAARSDVTSDSGEYSIDRESLLSLSLQPQHEEERRLSELASELPVLTLDSELAELTVDERGSGDMAYHRMTVKGNASSWGYKCKNEKFNNEIVHIPCSTDLFYQMTGTLNHVMFLALNFSQIVLVLSFRVL